MLYLAQQLLDPSKLPQTTANSNSLANILQIVFTIIGALAFLMLVISGLRYITTEGNPQKTAEVRRQIIYIAVGLVVAVLADTIVTFVVKNAS